MMGDGTKPSTMALAMQKKWQEAATTLGGKGTNIVMVKTQAKSLIFALLRDTFKPMNITSIYKVLKSEKLLEIDFKCVLCYRRK